MEGETLVVAPLVDEDYAQSEISALVNTLDAELLLGHDATSVNLLDKLAGQKWKIIWFVAHGEPYGVKLSDGIIGASALTSLIRGADPELVFFNTCSSLQVAMDIYNEVSTNFVCTVQDEVDSVAFFTGKQFASAIANGSSYHEAFQTSKPGHNRNYIFLSGFRPMPRDGSKREAKDGSINDCMQDLRSEVKRLATVIDGDARWNQRGLMTIAMETERRLEELILVYTMMRNSVIALIVINLAILTTIIILTVNR